MIRPLLLLAGLLQGGPPSQPSGRPAAEYPFAVGETLTYSAKLGMITLGSGTLQVAGIDSVRGVQTFRLRFRLQGKTVFYSLDDVLESWVATEDFASRRFVQDFVENDKPKHRTYEIFPDSGFYREKGRDTTFASPSAPLDDAAFFYFVRIVPLEVGKKYLFDRYFKKEKNPVTIEVVKREKMELPDGSKVQCLVLHPVIDTKGIFSKRSDTRIWLTDDARKLPVQIRSKFPFGTITLRLKDMVLPQGAASTSGG
ncbi:MAG: DUF3108 domain-containing protein [Gemmatimonadales bacterium]|nr:DUF3108 domain-containing protein [Gemmatimonadales bacterium]MBA3556561.1 DUF3108 domain-containing protein [Gemmatimonadales bacterium]